MNDRLEIVEKGFFLDGGCSGSTYGGNVPCETYAFDAGDLGSRKLNMMATGNRDKSNENALWNLSLCVFW